MLGFLARAALIAGAISFGTEAMAAAVEWNVSLWGKRRAFTEHIEKLAELLPAKTNGEFTLNLSYGGLSKPRENLDGISIGAFEMAQFCASYHPDKNPSLLVLELPSLKIQSLQQEREVSQGFYKHPAAIKDMEKWNATLLMPTPQPQYNLLGVGEPPYSLDDDFEGLTVRANQGVGAALKILGAVPTSMPAPEVRQALDSGVIKAAAFAPHAHMSFGTVAIGKWWTSNLNVGTINCPVVVNTDALNSLEPNHRDALLGSIDEALDYYVENYNGKTMDAWGPLLQELGIVSVTYSDEDLAAFRKKAAEPATQAWIDSSTAKGLPARELYDFVADLIEKNR